MNRIWEKRHTKLTVLLYVLLVGITFLIIASACSGNDVLNGGGENSEQTVTNVNNSENSDNNATNNDLFEGTDADVTIRVLGFNDQEELDMLLTEPMQANGYAIHYDHVPISNDQDLLTSESAPDLFIGSMHTFTFLESDEQTQDLTPFIDRHQMDVSNIEANYLTSIGDVSADDQLWGMPYRSRLSVLYYNPDVFDALGATYPEDGMTWAETIALGHELANMDTEEAYRYLGMNWFSEPASQLGLHMLDPETGESRVNDMEWIELFEELASVYQIPNNVTRNIMMDYNEFLMGHLAMYARDNINQALLDIDASWDVVTYPTFDQAPETAPVATLESLLMNPETDHPDAVFETIIYLLSEEAQLQLSKDGYYSSVLDDGEILRAFGQDMPGAGERNMAAFFKHPSAVIEVNEYDNALTIDDMWQRVWNGTTDIMRGRETPSEALEELDQYLNENRMDL